MTTGREAALAREQLAAALWEANFDGVLSERMSTVHGESNDSSYLEAADMILTFLATSPTRLDAARLARAMRNVKASIPAYSLSTMSRQATAIAAEYDHLPSAERVDVGGLRAALVNGAIPAMRFAANRLRRLGDPDTATRLDRDATKIAALASAPTAATPDPDEKEPG